MKRGGLLLLVVVVGCGTDRPSGLERLPVGSEALTHYDKTYGMPGSDDPNVVRVRVLSAKRRGDLDLDEIPVGTKVRVVEDSTPDDDRHERDVSVMVLEGKLAGEGVTIERKRLRPAR